MNESEIARRNRNRGYQQLRVWQESIDLYKAICKTFNSFPYTLAKIASQNIASADSIHRNFAEGYCLRSIKEYLQFLYVAIASLGETVSGITACHAPGQISDIEFDALDSGAFKLENGMLRLIERLEEKRDSKDWTDTLIARESNSVYDYEFRKE